MKSNATEVISTLSRRAALALTGAALLALAAGPALAKPGGNGGGKPGGGSGEDPSSNPAPVEYQLTWIPGINDGFIRIYDCNTAGNAVGTYADETATHKYRPFCTNVDGVITPLDNWWVLPPGYEDWRVGTTQGRFGGEMQINESNLVCGSIVNDLTSEIKLFLANLSEPNSLEPVGPVLSSEPRRVYMNERGDVAFSVFAGNDATLHLYVRSLDKMFGWEQVLRGYIPTGINDNLQVSLDYMEFILNTPIVITHHGSGLLTFISYDAVKDVVAIDIDDLGTAWIVGEPMTLPFGGINNAGTVFGCFETEAPKYRIHGGRIVRRSSNTTAGFIAADAETWTELDASLPIGGSLADYNNYVAAACALGVNESGQVVGGYNRADGYWSEDLWLRDPEDGLFDVNDLVVGDLADVEAFRAADNIGTVHITEEIDPETGYGIISGSASSSPSFILTPRLIEQP